MKTHMTPFLAASWLFASLQAAVMVETSDLHNGLATSGGTVSFSQNASTDTVLIFALMGDDFTTPGASGITVTYDPTGENLSTSSSLSYVEQSAAWVSILALEVGSISADSKDITVSFSSANSSNHEINIFQLSNATLTGVVGNVTDTATNGSVSTSPDFTGLGTGSLVLSAVSARNGSGSWTAAGSPTFSTANDSGAYTVGLSYESDTTGTVLSWTHSDTTDNHALGAIGIAAVPEPSTLVLSSLVLVSLFVLRKRVR